MATLTWKDLNALVERKMRESGCAADELLIGWIDTGTYPRERNLDVLVVEDRGEHYLRIECHS